LAELTVAEALVSGYTPVEIAKVFSGNQGDLIADLQSAYETFSAGIPVVEMRQAFQFAKCAEIHSRALAVGDTITALSAVKEQNRMLGLHLAPMPRIPSSQENLPEAKEEFY